MTINPRPLLVELSNGHVKHVIMRLDKYDDKLKRPLLVEHSNGHAFGSIHFTFVSAR